MKKIAYIALACSAMIAVACTFLAAQPDLSLSFVREAPSDLSSETLGKSVTALINWPKWFHSLEEAKAVDITGAIYPMKDQVLALGETIHLKFNPKKNPWSRYEVDVQVTAYEPNRSVTLRVLGDSKGKINRSLANVTWRIDLIPETGSSTLRTLVRGSATAQTSHWKSRLMGRIAERILMSQVFYPDVMLLASINHPLAPNPFSYTEQ